MREKEEVKLTEEELMTIVNDEIVNLGIGNRRFLERHEEIVKEVERLKALSRSKEEGGGRQLSIHK